MRQNIYLLLPLIILCSLKISAQDDCPCCTEVHRAFDFWEGDWTVYDTSGTEVGKNTVIKLEDGCILNEHWRGLQGTTGRSYNYFDKSDSTWNQLWIDNNGWNLKLKGRADAGVMMMESDLLPGQKVPFYRNRITWALEEDESVTQLWEILDEKGSVLQVAFHGFYRKTESIRLPKE